MKIRQDIQECDQKTKIMNITTSSLRETKKYGRIFIMHEYGAPRHFKALYYLASQGLIGIESAEFDIYKQIARLILYRENASLTRLKHNLCLITNLWNAVGQTIIVGAAPYSPIISLLMKLKERNQLIYFTSWPFWKKDQLAPKRPLISRQKKLWYEFLNSITAVAVTKATQEAIAWHGANVVHIPHCVDTEVFKPLTSFAIKDKIVILFVGRLVKEKGVHRLIDVIKARSWAGVEFWFVGKGPCESEIVSLSNERPVRYLGFISDPEQLADIYRKSDIFILPSIHIENFGIVLLEAMATGLPIVTTNCIGPKEIVDNGIEGYVIPQDNPMAMLEALGSLVYDSSKRIRFGMKGRTKVKQRYSIGVVAKKWISVLKCEKD